MTWKEAFATLQLEVEDRIGRPMRQRVQQINDRQDAAAGALRQLAEEAG